MNPMFQALRGFSLSFLQLSCKVNRNVLKNNSFQWISSCRASQQFTVCVEGNIGCGKSTLLKYLAQVMDVDIVPEPVHKWQNFRGLNLLEMMYTNPERWAFLFQTYVQKTMLENHLIESECYVKLLERSLHSARFCFVENLFLTGKLSEVEYLVYCKWYDAFMRYTDCTVDLIVYLRSDPVIAHRRITARARVGEQTIPLHYCNDLHQRYEEWIAGPDVPSPVVVIDANDTLLEMNWKYECIMKTIQMKSASKKLSC